MKQPKRKSKPKPKRPAGVPALVVNFSQGTFGRLDGDGKRV